VSHDAQRYQLIEATSLRESISDIGTAGEMELLDAINFMERGNYSDAIRRITTAIEVLVAAGGRLPHRAARRHASRGKVSKKTRLDSPGRISKYEALTGGELPDALKKDLNKTRTLRNHIGHGGYRLSPGERSLADLAVFNGQLTFNWFENDAQRKKVRESRPGFKSLGRDLSYNMFRPGITPDGVLLTPSKTASDAVYVLQKVSLAGLGDPPLTWPSNRVFRAPSTPKPRPTSGHFAFKVGPPVACRKHCVERLKPIQVTLLTTRASKLLGAQPTDDTERTRHPRRLVKISPPTHTMCSAVASKSTWIAVELGFGNSGRIRAADGRQSGQNSNLSSQAVDRSRFLARNTVSRRWHRHLNL
jgi:hypothetical protein